MGLPFRESGQAELSHQPNDLTNGSDGRASQPTRAYDNAQTERYDNDGELVTDEAAAECQRRREIIVECQRRRCHDAQPVVNLDPLYCGLLRCSRNPDCIYTCAAIQMCAIVGNYERHLAYLARHPKPKKRRLSCKF